MPPFPLGSAGIIGDGQRLAIGLGGAFHVLDGYMLRNLTCTSNWDGCTEYDFTIVTSSIARTIHSLDDARRIFQNAADLSIDDLLKLAYQRMESRQSS